jgi:hypothetical protein
MLRAAFLIALNDDEMAMMRAVRLTLRICFGPASHADARSLGAMRTLPKPLEGPRLLRAVNEVLSQ